MSAINLIVDDQHGGTVYFKVRANQIPQMLFRAWSTRTGRAANSFAFQNKRTGEWLINDTANGLLGDHVREMDVLYVN